MRSAEEAISLATGAIRDHLITVGPDDCVWVSGSTFDGLGHATSDVDVFVATPAIASTTPTTRRHNGFAVHAFIDARTRFDIEYWEFGCLRGLAEKLATVPLDDPDVNLVNWFSKWETEFIHRLFICVPLVNADAVRELRDMFDRTRLARYLYDTALHFYDNSYDDCIGMLEAGQLESAAIQARCVAGYAIDALLAASGSTSAQEKFRPERFKRMVRQCAGGGRLFARYWEIEAGVPATTAALGSYIRDTLAYGEQVLGVVQDAVLARSEADGQRGAVLLDEVSAKLFGAPQAVE